MSSPFVGEIRMFAGNFAPAGWMIDSTKEQRAKLEPLLADSPLRFINVEPADAGH